MMRVMFLAASALLLALPLSGCTDFVEPNQLAFVMATAVDHAEDGQIEVSHQIVIPSQLKDGGNADQFIVVSATGKNVYDASLKIQRKLPRRLMTSHRILIAIGESFFHANEVDLLFDKLGRDPANSFRDIVLMIRGGSAKSFVMLKHPMEYLSSRAASKELQINGLKNFTSRQFVIDSQSDGNRPVVPVFRVENTALGSEKQTPLPVFSGFAVLDKRLKARGFLEVDEAFEAIWMAGKGSIDGLTIPWKSGHGLLSFRLTHLGRSIRTVRGNPGQVVLTVKAQSYLLENTADLDMADVDKIASVQKYVNAYCQKQLQQTMNKVQRRGTDVFGIGEHLHRHYPSWWKRHRTNWDADFKTIRVTVKTNIQLRSVGVTGGELK